MFGRSQFIMPTFHQVGSIDFEVIDSIGKIVDNSDFSIPLVLFNT